MPLYEYYCSGCGGIFEALRSLRESSEPASCPLCDRESKRIMPTSFTAFSVREGLPRQLPDRGTWHLGKEVKEMNTGVVPAFEHSELYSPVPKKELGPGDQDDIGELDHLKRRHAQMLEASGERPSVGRDGRPNLSPQLGASGHVGAQEVWSAEKARALRGSYGLPMGKSSACRGSEEEINDGELLEQGS
jgi:putative FmdB family regulatory protein